MSDVLVDLKKNKNKIGMNRNPTQRNRNKNPPGGNVYVSTRRFMEEVGMRKVRVCHEHNISIFPFFFLQNRRGVFIRAL